MRANCEGTFHPGMLKGIWVGVSKQILIAWAQANGRRFDRICLHPVNYDRDAGTVFCPSLAWVLFAPLGASGVVRKFTPFLAAAGCWRSWVTGAERRRSGG